MKIIEYLIEFSGNVILEDNGENLSASLIQSITPNEIKQFRKNALKTIKEMTK